MFILKGTVFVLCLLLHGGDAFILTDEVSRQVTKVLVVGNGGRFGDWHNSQFCAEGSFATGYNMKLEGDQGSSGDDTALNAVMLKCTIFDGNYFGGTIMSGEASWGNWVGETNCNSENGAADFLTAFSLQVERDQGSGDDTTANFIKFMCRDFYANNTAYEIHQGVGHGLWGEFGAWSDSCEPESAICGIQAKIESPQGHGDDTGLNDVKLFCCAFT